MTKTIVLGTRNQGKIAEFRDLLAEEKVTLLSWKDFDYPFSVIEDGKTFWENALKKAKLTALITGEVSVADDSGLEIACLGQQPGVFSARFSGPQASDEDNNEKVIQKMNGIPLSERGARFVCAVVICAPDGKWEKVEGECQGVITESPRGKQGFGYDPLFLVPDLGKTFAELSKQEKNRISHRAQAVEKLRFLLEKYFIEK